MLTLLHYTQTCASLPSGTKQVVLKSAQEHKKRTGNYLPVLWLNNSNNLDRSAVA